MWRLSLDQGHEQHFDHAMARDQLGRKKPVLCRLILNQRPAISTGDVRLIKGWNFLRDEPKRGPKLKPTSMHTSHNDTLRHFDLKKSGIYLADSVNAAGERFFTYFSLDYEDIEVLDRHLCRERFFALDGEHELALLLDELSWTKAWATAQCASPDLRPLMEARCFEAVRQAMKQSEEAALQGQDRQIPWAASLRESATQLLRVTWRSLMNHPTLPTSRPRLRYALLTCAYALKTQPRAELFIAADYHISRAQVHEIVDRFCALGKHQASSPKSMAAPLSADELATIQRLAGAIRP